jgi:hypothetical protein
MVKTRFGSRAARRGKAIIHGTREIVRFLVDAFQQKNGTGIEDPSRFSFFNRSGDPPKADVYWNMKADISLSTSLGCGVLVVGFSVVAS